jgi:hypothetical protein
MTLPEHYTPAISLEETLFPDSPVKVQSTHSTYTGASSSMLLYRHDHNANSRRRLGQYSNRIEIVNFAARYAEQEASRLPRNGFKVVPNATGYSIVLSGTHVSYDIVFEGSDEGEAWKWFVALMRSGVQVEMDIKMYVYWRDVLPPPTMGKTHKSCGVDLKTHFTFCEGCDRLVGFWFEPLPGHPQGTDWWEAEKNRYFCQLTDEMNPNA